MTYMLILVSIAFIAAGAIGLHVHDRGGWPFIIIGVGALIYLGFKSFPHRTKGGEGGE